MADELSQPLYAQLRDAIRARILEGALSPGDRLPSESELSAVHGVSRITVRQALGDLQKAGLITRQQGRGAFVAPPRASPSLQRLQGLAEALAPDGRSVHSKRLSLRSMRAPAAVARKLGLAAGDPVTQLVSLRYLDRTPLSVNVSHFAAAVGDRMARIDVSGRDFIDVLENDLGRPVREARLEIRAGALSTREARWLGATAGAPALHVHRLVLGAGDVPLQVESATYPADRFSYRLTLAR